MMRYCLTYLGVATFLPRKEDVIFIVIGIWDLSLQDLSDVSSALLITHLTEIEAVSPLQINLAMVSLSIRI
jgi:hypothetical protein